METEMLLQKGSLSPLCRAKFLQMNPHGRFSWRKRPLQLISLPSQIHLFVSIYQWFLLLLVDQCSYTCLVLLRRSNNQLTVTLCMSRFVGILQTRPFVYPWPAVCFDFPGRQLRQLTLAYFQLLKPFLSFISHRITVLIAQNVAKAFIVDL